jgi:hypothetical protein
MAYMKVFVFQEVTRCYCCTTSIILNKILKTQTKNLFSILSYQLATCYTHQYFISLIDIGLISALKLYLLSSVSLLLGFILGLSHPYKAGL